MATTNTISGQITRISNAANTIWNKIAEIRATIPQGSYWDYKSNNDVTLTGTNNYISGTSSPEQTYTTSSGSKILNLGIDAVAAAINNLNICNYLGLFDNALGAFITATTVPIGTNALKPGKSIYIPEGYNKTAYSIKASDLSTETLDATAKNYYIYKDKTAYVNGEKITGTLENVYLYDTLGSPNANKVYTQAGNKYLQVNIKNSSDPQYNSSEVLKTNIVYRTPSDDLAYIKSGNKLKITIPSGYYDLNWSTDIEYDPYVNTDLEINKVTTAEGGEAITINSVVIPAGYYSNPIEIQPVLHTVVGSDPDRILNYYYSATDLAINDLSGKLLDLVYGTYDYFDPNQKFAVKNGSVTLAVNKSDSGITINPAVVAGWITSSKVTGGGTIAGSISHSITTYNDNKFGGSTAQSSSNITSINKQYLTDVLGQGYNHSTKTKYYKVLDCTFSKTTGLVTRIGWFNDLDENNNPYYITTSTESGKTITPGNTQTTISKGSYITGDIVIDSVSAGTGKITYTSLRNLSGPSTFTPSSDEDAATPTYFNKFIVDVTGLLLELAKI